MQLEIDLRRKVAEVAAARAALPEGGRIAEDYCFTALVAGKPVERRLSELFGFHDSLLIYSFMYGPHDEAPCPMCTSFLDSLNAAAPHVGQRTGLAVVTSAPIETSSAFADQRGWTALPMLSCTGNSYNRDDLGESPDGAQLPMCNVFHKKPNGDIHHFWTSEMFFAGLDGQPRHLDTIWPLWNIFDMLPHGRGTDWYPALDYGDT